MLTYLCAAALTSKEKSLVWLIPIVALACMVAYPLFLPSCTLLVGVVGICMIASQVKPRLALARHSIGSIAALAGGSVIALGLVALYLAAIGTFSAKTPARFAGRDEILLHGKQILLAFGPLALALIPAALQWRRGKSVTLAPVAMAAAGGLLLSCFAVLEMPLGVEYKFLFSGLIVLTPVASWGIAEAVANRPLRLAVLGLLLSAAVTAACYGLWQKVPPNLVAARTLDELTWAIHPDEGWDTGWMKALRDLTPPDTVLLTEDTDQPVPVFTRRSLYVTADGSEWSRHGRTIDGALDGRIGYTLDGRTSLVLVKGYSLSTIKARQAVQRLCFAAQADERDLQSALAGLASLNRPIAFHFSAASAMRERLEQIALGRSVFSNNGETVWLMLPAQIKEAAALTSVDEQSRNADAPSPHHF